MAPGQQDFKFELSLSVLNHLGRNLYRNFVTVLGEAISNSWDADAKNVWIDIDRDNDTFSIKDDGIGMSAGDFQGKFLKIGYSKRKDGKTRTVRDRPYIGAKGIGKLALLSCAERISVYTKKRGFDYVGGTIDNGQLDQAITDDLTPQQYELERVDADSIKSLSGGHSQGTIICFHDMKGSIRNSEKFIRKTLAMSFKFSLIDDGFNIHVNGKKVDIGDLKDLAEGTQFLWLVNDYEDPYLSTLKHLKADPVSVTSRLPIKGFLATVVKPRDAKIDGTDERASLDLFVNGRLREKNILRHIPTQRILESYLYGQIHYDSMDRGTQDPFTSSREGVLESDEEFQKLLKYLQKKLIPRLLEEWDDLRRSINEEGDDEDTRVSKKDRKAKAFVSVVEKEYSPKKGEPNKPKVDEWLSSIRSDAEYNISAYVDCFLTENLLRKFIVDQSVVLSSGAVKEVDKWRRREEENLAEANISHQIIQQDNNLNYLGMDLLSILSEGRKNDDNGNLMPLCMDHVTYRPIRNAVGHTSLLTGAAKNRLNLTLENIKGRLTTLLKRVKA
ncbi:ATP-binding protein [Salinicola halophyticus]|uniref:ATP-binding protein n=1 Tax=Salinicola halophyticus TaxID=1808881 RepID=UPI003F48E33D